MHPYRVAVAYCKNFSKVPLADFNRQHPLELCRVKEPNILPLFQGSRALFGKTKIICKYNLYQYLT